MLLIIFTEPGKADFFRANGRSDAVENWHGRLQLDLTIQEVETPSSNPPSPVVEPPIKALEGLKMVQVGHG